MILLDTCAIVWDALTPGKLTDAARDAIEDPGNELIVSDISLWEIAMLIGKKRLVVDETIAGFIGLALEARDIQVAGITPEIAGLSVEVGPAISNDPADRLIAATSIARNAPVVTADRGMISASMIDTIW